MGLGDTLDLANVAFGPNTTVGYSGTAAGGTLTVTNGSQTANIALLGNYMASTFTLGSQRAMAAPRWWISLEDCRRPARG